MGVRATARFHWEAQALLMMKGAWDLQGDGRSGPNCPKSTRTNRAPCGASDRGCLMVLVIVTGYICTSIWHKDFS
jgi:hypothetical protein